jgi:hypothetical protein
MQKYNPAWPMNDDWNKYVYTYLELCIIVIEE